MMGEGLPLDRFPPLCLTSADSASFVAAHQPSTAPQVFRNDTQTFLEACPVGEENELN